MSMVLSSMAEIETFWERKDCPRGWRPARLNAERLAEETEWGKGKKAKRECKQSPGALKKWLDEKQEGLEEKRNGEKCLTHKPPQPLTFPVLSILRAEQARLSHVHLSKNVPQEFNLNLKHLGFW